MIREVSQKKTPDALAALKRAAKKAQERARRSGTAAYVMENGRSVTRQACQTSLMRASATTDLPQANVRRICHRVSLLPSISSVVFCSTTPALPVNALFVSFVFFVVPYLLCVPLRPLR
jgi:hypothetical protein